MKKSVSSIKGMIFAMFKNIRFNNVLVLFFIVLLSGCGNTPHKKWDTREFSLLSAIEETNKGTTGHFKEIVDEKKQVAMETKEFRKNVEYQYWKSASIVAIKQLVNNFINSNKKELAIELALEGLAIDPNNIKIKSILRVLQNKETKSSKYSRNISPTSYTAIILNHSFIQNSMSVYNSRVSETGNRGLLDFASANTKQGHRLYGILSDDTLNPGMTLGEKTIANLFDMLSYKNINVVFHASANRIKRSENLIPGFTNWMDVLSFIAQTEEVNFLLFKNKIFVFSGEEVPYDLGGLRERVLSFRSSNQPIDSIITSVRAVGFGGNISNVDSKNNTVWLKGKLGNILRAISTISLLDAPKAQLKLTLEIVEIQHSLVTELGAKIPDFINIDFASQFRDGGLNGTTLQNLRRISFKETLRAVSTDPLLSIAAKQENYSVDLIEKPVLRMEDGGHAEINVGDRIPVITSTANSTGFVSERVSYIDTGVKVNVDAKLKNDGRIHLNLKVEASHMTKTVESNNGSSAPQLGSRKINSTMVLQDGETAMLGGLSFLRNVESTSGIPGLTLNEFIGTLAGGKYQGNSSKADLMIFVTPEILEQSMLPSRHVFHTTGEFE